MAAREEYIKFFQHMEDEDKKSALGPMACDEVGWWFYNATKKDKLFTGQELKNLYPYLFRFYDPKEEENDV